MATPQKILIVTLALFASSPALAQTTAGSVTGRVSYAGPAPKAATIKATTDVEVCGKGSIPDESLIVGADKGIKNAVVAIAGLPGGKQSPMKATLDQVGCVYVPHVQAVTVGSELLIRSSDSTLHNTHAFQGGNTRFNIALPLKGSKSKQKLPNPGHVSFKCDAGHSWMDAHAWVFDHPYFAVTDASGDFAIANVPEGTHKVTVWHEKLGELSATVEVKADQKATLNLTMSSK
ncbi:MAG: carboxypeptidase regulatory-like domain-containing protein [Deltaproteobacteria bacterium]|nr:carboxypeptidase regulatory-like domain-containing protein [Deltaproteobacteria bacterium]